MPFKDREKARVSANKYLNTESGFMVAKWCDISKKFNKAEKLARGENPRNSSGSVHISKLEHTLTKEEFFQAWEEHKIKYGMTCYYTGKPMKIRRKLAVKGAKKRHPTPPDLLSIDRFDSEIGYTKDNIVFCRWDVNNEKGSMSVCLAKIMVRKYLERIQRPGRRLYQTGGLVGAEDYTTSMDFGLWNRDGVRRIQKQIKEMYEEE